MLSLLTFRYVNIMMPFPYEVKEQLIERPYLAWITIVFILIFGTTRGEKRDPFCLFEDPFCMEHFTAFSLTGLLFCLAVMLTFY